MQSRTPSAVIYKEQDKGLSLQRNTAVYRISPLYLHTFNIFYIPLVLRYYGIELKIPCNLPKKSNLQGIRL